MGTDSAIVSWERIAQEVYPQTKLINSSIYGVTLYQLNPQFPSPTLADITSMHIPKLSDIKALGIRARSIAMRAINEGGIDMTTGKPIV